MGYILALFIGGIIIAVVLQSTANKKTREAFNLSVSKLKNSGYDIEKECSNITLNTNVSLLINNNKSKWAVVSSKPFSERVYNHSDIVEYELLEDGGSVVKGRVGSAIVGGALFGAAGAVVGSARSKNMKSTCTSMQIRITVNDFNNPNVIIPIVVCETNKQSLFYKGAQKTANEFISTLALIKAKAESELNINTTANSSINDIEKLFDLKEKGIITEQEFEDKKKQLLNA